MTTPCADRPVILAIEETSRVGEARRVASTLAGKLGFDETGRGRAALVATEAATNLLKHAGGGTLILQAIERGGACGLEVLALDRGPGMADVGRCLADGYSTAGSPGNGLGAMGRLASDFEVHSLPGVGTALMARLWPGTPPPGSRGPAGLSVGAVSVPAPGEEVCGDGWGVVDDRGTSLVMVADGLGHGPEAAEAARVALRVFRDRHDLGPVGILQAAHSALRSTRGAAVAVAQLDRDRGEVRYAGVGNIAGVVLEPDSGRSTSMVSQNGTVGHAVRKTQEFTYSWRRGALLIMHSDGLASHWQLGRYAGLAARDPGLIAGVLYRDFARGRDDATVVAVRDLDPMP